MFVSVLVWRRFQEPLCVHCRIGSWKLCFLRRRFKDAWLEPATSRLRGAAPSYSCNSKSAHRPTSMPGAPFQLFTAADVPQHWIEALHRERNGSHDMQCERLSIPKGQKFNVDLVVDLPDHPDLKAYYFWAQSQPDNGCPAYLMLTSWQEKSVTNPDECIETLRSLYQTGKPAPNIGLLWHK